jgi:hypothetical protein
VDGWWAVPRVREQLEEAVGKAYIVAVRGSRNYYEHLVSVGANPHYAFKGAVSWTTNWSPYNDFYYGVVAPCLDEHGVMGQDRTFWVAWSYHLMKTILGGVTTASMPPQEMQRFINAVVDRFFGILSGLDVPNLPFIMSCIRDNMGFGVGSPTEARREGE